jgi:AraC-like DNA-binding protein
VDKSDDSRVALILGNHFDRRALAPGLDAWVYRYRNRRRLRIPQMVSTAFEIGVQLSGDWLNQGRFGGDHLHGPGEVVRVSPGERFAYSFEAGAAEGVQVGFHVYPAELDGLVEDGYDLRFTPRRSVRDRRLLALCRDYRAAAGGGAPDPAVTRAEVLRFIAANAELSRRDPLAEARAEIERTFDLPLYREHFAGIAGMHPTTFSRAFARRYGVTPTRYRLELRINAAIRLAWSRRDLPLSAIAARVGFEDMPYFHRTFVERLGLTPAQLGRRVTVEGGSKG